MPIYIIEHLEPKLWPWCVMEYKHISRLVGKSNLLITNIKSNSDKAKLSKYAKVLKQSVSSLMLNRACVLDPEAAKLLSPKTAKKCKYFIFGGILGDYPPRKRTKAEPTSKLKGIPSFNIGKEQMSTDNAVYTVNSIVKGKPLSEIHFQQGLEIKISKTASIELPYRYILVKGKPLISKGLINYLKKKKSF